MTRSQFVFNNNDVNLSLRESVHRRKLIRPAAAAEHGRFLNEVALIPGHGHRAELLIDVLVAQGQAAVSPFDRSNLHPLLVPLAQQGDTVTGFLRWPTNHKSIMALPIVSMKRRGAALALLARSTDEFIHRALLEEDISIGEASTTEQGRKVAQAAGTAGKEIYLPGGYTSSGASSVNAYLTKCAGMYTDVAESLTAAHLSRGDTMSALITAEWYMRASHFPGWGRPFEYASQVMKGVGRDEEARDIARIALRMPWWTFLDGYQGVRDIAGLSGGVEEIRNVMIVQDEMSNGGNLPGLRTNVKTKEEEALDDASWLLNRPAAGEASWDDIKEELASKYKEAGLSFVGDFVMI